jgi:negative regulator of sigma E activity
VKRPWIALTGTLAAAAAVGAAAAALIVPAIAPDPAAGPSPTTSATGAPPATGTALTQREQTALDAARIMTTWTPAKDHNRTAAEQRARHLMTDERAQAVVAPERPATGTEWLEAADRGATSVPTVEPNTATELTDTGVSVTATWTWDSPDGSEIPAERGTEPRIYFFEFTEENKIHDYTY